MRTPPPKDEEKKPGGGCPPEQNHAPCGPGDTMTHNTGSHLEAVSQGTPFTSVTTGPSLIKDITYGLSSGSEMSWFCVLDFFVCLFPKTIEGGEVSIKKQDNLIKRKQTTHTPPSQTFSDTIHLTHSTTP